MSSTPFVFLFSCSGQISFWPLHVWRRVCLRCEPRLFELLQIQWPTRSNRCLGKAFGDSLPAALAKDSRQRSFHSRERGNGRNETSHRCSPCRASKTRPRIGQTRQSPRKDFSSNNAGGNNPCCCAWHCHDSSTGSSISCCRSGS